MSAEATTWDDVHFALRSRSFEQVAPAGGHSDGIELPVRITGDSVLMARGEAHVERRRLESALFRLPTLRMYEQQLVRPRLERTLAALAARRGPDGTARGDLIAIGQATLLEVMAALVGVDVSTPE